MANIDTVIASMGSEEFGKDDLFTFYKDNNDDFRRRRESSNGRIVGASTEGYTSGTNAAKNAIRNGLTPYHACDIQY